MKKLLVFIILGMFLMSFAFAANGNGKDQNQTENTGEDSMIQIQTEIQEGEMIQTQTEIQEGEMIQTRTKIKAKIMTQAEIHEVTQEKNKLQIQTQTQECPDDCECTGSVTKCQLQEGREMTVRAGNSGNMIIQFKGVDAETTVELYQSEGKVYGVFKGNQTKIINIFPDQVKERVRAEINANVEDEIIELDEEGVYQVQAKKRVKLLGLFTVREKVRMEINSETGEVMRVRTSWWGFLARDEVEQLIGGCGTVTPGMNDECCQNQGYEFWNSETAECE